MRVQNTALILGERGWGRQGKGISISTMQKGAVLLKCVNTYVIAAISRDPFVTRLLTTFCQMF